MIGKSYDGTIANGVAATGVEGLKTIVPIGAISSWYDYYFAKGAPLYDSGPEWLSDYVESPDARATCGAVQQQLVDGAPRTGDLDPAVDRARLRARTPARSGASVFVVHGMQDLNVRTKHFGQWWDALAEARRRAQDLALPDRPRRPVRLPPRRVGRHPAPLVRPLTPRLRQRHRREPMADIERAPRPVGHRPVWPPRATDRPRPSARPRAASRASAPSACASRPGAPRPSPTTRR